jgi:hypothetical protein
MNWGQHQPIIIPFLNSLNVNDDLFGLCIVHHVISGAVMWLYFEYFLSDFDVFILNSLQFTFSGSNMHRFNSSHIIDLDPFFLLLALDLWQLGSTGGAEHGMGIVPSSGIWQPGVGCTALAT